MKTKLGAIEVNYLPHEPEAFNYPISREEAVRLLTSYKYLPFRIMCKNYYVQGEWEELESYDLDENNQLKAAWQTLEIWFIPRNIGADFQGNKYKKN